MARKPRHVHVYTTKFGTGGSIAHAWRYAYDDSGRLVGTSNAMGCGVNYYYDTASRLVGSDYSPCTGEQAPYSAPDLSTGDNLESFIRYDDPDPNATGIVDGTGRSLTIASNWLWGRVVSSYTRGDVQVYAYDGLGQTIGTAKRVARPGMAAAKVSDRYAPRWYIKDASYDYVGRPIRASTGAPMLAQLGPDGASDMRMSYTRRGLVDSVQSSYGRLISGETHDARGLVQQIVYGDAAQTQRAYSYNELNQLTTVQTYRGYAPLWSAPQGSSPYVPPPANGPSTTQTLLEDYTFAYDVIGNLTQAQDWRMPDEWAPNFKPVNRTFEYDSYSRLTKTTYSYAGGNTWQSPFDAENTTATRLPQPVPQVSFTNRIAEETFTYDWLNNLVQNNDDSNGFYDRSIGTSTFGIATAPHRLTNASNRSTGSSKAGQVDVAYDDVGQVTGMIVQRDGGCLPLTASCWQRFAYEWDEIGNLQRARRWDLTTAERTSNGTLALTVPARTPDAELKYGYAGTSRVVKTSETTQGEKHSVYIFATLELRTTTYAGTGAAADYVLSTDTTQVRLSAGSVSARLVIDATMPHLTSSNQHLLLQFGDRLGSTSFTIDQATGELVQYTTYSSYGTSESDYRPARWNSYREPYRFTGKEDDMEVGLSYHGARYYSPALHRWMSPDPVTVHSSGSDVNPYAYGFGNPTSYVDPDGRCPTLIAGLIGAVISSVAYVVQNGVHFDDGKWRAGLGIAAGSGFVAGMTGYGAGVFLGEAASAVGVASSGIIASPLIGATAGAASSASAYLSAWGGTVAVNAINNAVTGNPYLSEAGYSTAGLGKVAGLGAVSGAFGGAFGWACTGNHVGLHGLLGKLVGGTLGTAAGYYASAKLSKDGDKYKGWESFGLALGSSVASTMASAAAAYIERGATLARIQERMNSATDSTEDRQAVIRYAEQQLHGEGVEAGAAKYEANLNSETGHEEDYGYTDLDGDIHIGRKSFESAEGAMHLGDTLAHENSHRVDILAIPLDAKGRAAYFSSKQEEPWFRTEVKAYGRGQDFTRDFGGNVDVEKNNNNGLEKFNNSLYGIGK